MNEEFKHWLILGFFLCGLLAGILISTFLLSPTKISVEETNQNLNLYFNEKTDYPFAIVDTDNINVVSRTDTLLPGQAKSYILRGIKSPICIEYNNRFLNIIFIAGVVGDEVNRISPSENYTLETYGAVSCFNTSEGNYYLQLKRNFANENQEINSTIFFKNIK